MYELKPEYLVGLAVLLLDLVAFGNLFATKESWVEKIVWGVIVLLLPVVGAMLYFGRAADKRSANGKHF